MVTTVRSDLTWDGQVGKALSKTSEKKIRQTLKDMTGAIDIDIIEVNSWSESEDEAEEFDEWYEKTKRSHR